MATVYLAHQMRDFGLPVEEISRRLELSSAQVKEILTIVFSDENLSEDVRNYVQGEFFYEHTESDPEGFFILSIPRQRKIVFHIVKESYRPFSREFLTQEGNVQDLGRLKIYGY